MSELKVEVGTPIRFKAGDALIRRGKYLGTGKRTWIRFREDQPRHSGHLTVDFMDQPRQGFIIGQRTLSNGDFTRGYSTHDWEGGWDSEPNEYHVTETFQAYLVVESLRGAPVKIRVEDVMF